MLKKSLSFMALLSFSVMQTAMAADPLHNTHWQTFDDKTGNAKGVITLTETNGVLSGRIVKVLTKENQTVCTTCKGKYADKPLVGLTVIRNLKPKGNGQYADGTILDPKKGKSYKLKATLDGKELKVRGFVGISLLGRTQTWKQLPTP